MKFNKKRLEEKSVEISTDTFRLPGTLTLPKGGSRLPVLILVHGSGPNDRDETLGPNKLFRDIAWGLAEQGIAVLRYDKRTKVYGTAAYPQGVEATFDNEVVDDVISAVRLVKSLPEIDSARVYVLGHSLGGMLVPRIAQRAGEGCLGGIISLAGPVPEDGTAIDRANDIYLFSFGYAAGCESGGRAGDEFASGVIPENGNRIPTGRGSPDVETSFPCVTG